MSLIGAGRMDDGIKKGSDRKVVNMDLEVVEAVKDCAEKLEGKLGFRPTFGQALRYIVKELSRK
jgi:hypothetical protein